MNKIQYSDIKLKKLNLNHYSSNYLKWMNDKKVLEFTEQKYSKHTKKDILDFIRTKQISKLCYHKFKEFQKESSK